MLCRHQRRYADGRLGGRGRIHRIAAANRGFARVGSGTARYQGKPERHSIDQDRRHGRRPSCMNPSPQWTGSRGVKAGARAPGHDHHHDHHHHQPPRIHSAESHSTRMASLPEIRSLLMAADPTQRALELSSPRLLCWPRQRVASTDSCGTGSLPRGGWGRRIVDIACCAAAADALDLDAWYCSPVNVGSGFVNCATVAFRSPPQPPRSSQEPANLLSTCTGGTGHAYRRCAAPRPGLPI